MKKIMTPVFLVLLFAALSLFASLGEDFDPAQVAAGRGWTLFNRAATALVEDGRAFVRLDERPGSGIAWLEAPPFADGTIEFDVRGKNVAQRSFVGVAFHGLNDETFEAVYFRPFNFKDADPAKAAHSVQYVSHPEFTWQKLRAERPSEFEATVRPVPDPESWFHVKVEVLGGKVRVFVNSDPAPCLVVDELGGLAQGKVGLFVGNASGGDFAGLKITSTGAGAPGRPAGDGPAARPPAVNIHAAVRAGDLARVRAFLESDPASVNAVDERGLPPLLVACLPVKDMDIVRCLVEHGADVNFSAKYAGTLLDIVFENTDGTAVPYLESKGARFSPIDLRTAPLRGAVSRITFAWGMLNNVAVSAGPDGVLIVDSGFSKRAAPELRKILSGLGTGELKVIVNSHLHEDHTAGNILAGPGVRVVNASELGRPGSVGAHSLSAPLKGPGGSTLGNLTAMSFNGEDVLFIPYPHLHSEDDILTYFRGSGVVHMGDLLLSQSCPALVNVSGYMAFLDKVIDVFPAETIFLSGHGRDLTMDGVKKYRADLQAMIDIVKREYARGRSIEDMIKDDVLRAYKADYSQLEWLGPDSWVRRVFYDLKAGRL
jgi:glyoxylase-like metal-dependent hydrolase (beta-lactamase superfamily II)